MESDIDMEIDIDMEGDINMEISYPISDGFVPPQNSPVSVAAKVTAVIHKFKNLEIRDRSWTLAAAVAITWTTTRHKLLLLVEVITVPARSQFIQIVTYRFNIQPSH
ncbi:hypothetical protein LA080_015383 [Diaporthe eres]|nr:hypothetical protein LA080_015383 [Diaporthe eres]